MDKQISAMSIVIVIVFIILFTIASLHIDYITKENQICEDLGFDEKVINLEVEKSKIIIDNKTFINCQKTVMSEDNKLEIINEWVEKDKSQIDPFYEDSVFLYIIIGDLIFLVVSGILISRWGKP